MTDIDKLETQCSTNISSVHPLKTCQHMSGDRKLPFTQQNELDSLWCVHPHLKSGCLWEASWQGPLDALASQPSWKDRAAATGWQEHDVES